jgi:hypothetical protein
VNALPAHLDKKECAQYALQMYADNGPLAAVRQIFWLPLQRTAVFRIGFSSPGVAMVTVSVGRFSKDGRQRPGRLVGTAVQRHRYRVQPTGCRGGATVLTGLSPAGHATAVLPGRALLHRASLASSPTAVLRSSYRYVDTLYSTSRYRSTGGGQKFSCACCSRAWHDEGRSVQRPYRVQRQSGATQLGGARGGRVICLPLLALLAKEPAHGCHAELM